MMYVEADYDRITLASCHKTNKEKNMKKKTNKS